jgi:hypothetical protein
LNSVCVFTPLGIGKADALKGLKKDDDEVYQLKMETRLATVRSPTKRAGEAGRFGACRRAFARGQQGEPKAVISRVLGVSVASLGAWMRKSQAGDTLKRTRDPLLPPESAVMRSCLALG